MKQEQCTSLLVTGGGLLADLILGHTPVVAVEWDGYACQVLRECAADGWFPGLRVWEGDVQLFDPSEYAGKVDCIHAGFPCTDLSVAGKQAGLGEGTRSGLYREIIRIAGIVRPKQLYLENVSAILGGGLECVLSDLAALGFDAKWCCIRASDVGANHQRDRWFLLANTNKFGPAVGTQGKTRETLPNSIRDYSQEERERHNINAGTSGVCSDVADTDSAQRQRNERTQRSEQEYADTSGPGWWEAESLVGRVANGVPNRVHRLKGLGNAQVPLQAAVAYRLLNG